jgi:hypothetical protein
MSELKRILRMNYDEFKEITGEDIDHWYHEQGKFCSGCAEGKMKEHARIKSSKPLSCDKPGGVTVGDIMFVEGPKNVKKPMMVNVDVCTKYVIGIPMENRTEEECLKALKKVDAIYERNNCKCH